MIANVSKLISKLSLTSQIATDVWLLPASVEIVHHALVNFSKERRE